MRGIVTYPGSMPPISSYIDLKTSIEYGPCIAIHLLRQSPLSSRWAHHRHAGASDNDGAWSIERDEEPSMSDNNISLKEPPTRGSAWEVVTLLMIP